MNLSFKRTDLNFRRTSHPMESLRLKSRSIPFTEGENSYLAQLYADSKDEYEGKFVSGSAGSQFNKRTKTDFCELWARRN
ncbi:hypothetical protein L596_016743 [Steinernema carpocapsae]|uniref:Uncharacterized protein n=1 Tax=Steinernema carpocapsae TaxID=34508 RepID=A0A4U5NJQ5_STECR|nr:hypothetical protein L596_016743 [Steinernema carpocapsae]